MKNVSKLTELEEAYEGSYYTISGVGGDPEEWVTGYEEELEKAEIGKPKEWWLTTGAAVNLFVRVAMDVEGKDLYPLDVKILMFPLEGLDVGKLGGFKLQWADRWFDDVINNMKRGGLHKRQWRWLRRW